MTMCYLRQKNVKLFNNTVPFEVGFENNATCLQVHPPLCVPRIGAGVTRHHKQSLLTKAEINYTSTICWEKV